MLIAKTSKRKSSASTNLKNSRGELHSFPQKTGSLVLLEYVVSSTLAVKLDDEDCNICVTAEALKQLPCQLQV